ncbi:MAG: lactate utilization protein [Phycisphaerae bacterium]|nr:lactate utilization protein [Phycisphaerae bacterium]MDW8262075.1 lactate utilization protein B [Phycisphaerales bacterium]
MRTIALQQFRHAADVAVSDADRRQFLRSALAGYASVRSATTASYQDYPAARSAAAAIKWDALENLADYLEAFESKLTSRGVHVHWAADASSARDYVLDVLQRHDAKLVIKSKTMTSEEIHLNSALEHAGYEVVESDLGELIVQLNREAPYHFVFPSMHLRRAEIKAIFDRAYGETGSDDPQELTMIARRVLRRQYLRADVGISGANFGVAESGAIAITENEGNSRLTCAMPKVHIVLMGIEKIVPRLADLALLQPMLATAGTGQLLTGYNSLYFGPRRAGEVDGPEEMHVVLLDNRRTAILADPELRDALRCIRCGACLNVCPIFKNVGGHSYGVTYQGPIGAVIEPHLRDVSTFGHLSYASSLCGACTETCPVGIDIHHHLLRNRRRVAERKPWLSEAILFQGFALLMRFPWLLGAVGRVMRWFDRFAGALQGSMVDPFAKWRATRTLPTAPKRSFKDYWRKRAAR